MERYLHLFIKSVKALIDQSHVRYSLKIPVWVYVFLHTYNAVVFLANVASTVTSLRGWVETRCVSTQTHTLFFFPRLYLFIYWAILGSQQNWEESTKTSHISPLSHVHSLPHGQHPPTHHYRNLTRFKILYFHGVCRKPHLSTQEASLYLNISQLVYFKVLWDQKLHSFLMLDREISTWSCQTLSF